MRVPLFGVLMVLVSLGLIQSGAAMDAVDGAAPTGTAARVGSLSPDEQRRALRARQRAASKSKAVDVRPRETTPLPIVPKTEPPRQAASSIAVEHPRPIRAASGYSHRRLARRHQDDRYRQDAALRRDPRVGDVVPRGVTLYALPADTRVAYPPYPRSPPGFPPFPRF